LPNQTLSSFQQSINFCVQHEVPVIHAFPLMLLRGTPLYEEKEKLGLQESYEIASSELNRLQVDIPHVISSPSFTHTDWQAMAKIAEELETHYNTSNKYKPSVEPLLYS
jgi:coproporphyrinogen III oxidase-like Fe-S oxidoreductase